MCSAKDWLQSPTTHCHTQPSSRSKSKVRVHCLIIRRRYKGTKAEDIELKNLKLYLENRSILEENEKLRQKAIWLRQENLALLSQFQKKFKSSQPI
ncbi:protein LITTLE ZIPPER 3-like [Amaranthus tricolor]|uniref:protein LITTLE ZIPPER 3-like n=1 Tax=Amaranthus tricolor TaxID=29722 RepID=UPI00258383B8|nr:protein LITTLE ZIPPER 3-like [Amaranthus tricolor]